MSRDALGDRMKNYEKCYRFFIPSKSWIVIRIDGKAFHSWTKPFERPYDKSLSRSMDDTALALCAMIDGALFGYVQSDEISIVICNNQSINAEPWFGNNLQKIVSVSASIATAAFNACWAESDLGLAYFDSRAFILPYEEEVVNYLIWRQQDATRNSIASAAQSVYSHKELHGKNSDQQQELLFQKGINWNDYPVGFKRGRSIIKKNVEKVVQTPDGELLVNTPAWAVDQENPIFTQDRGYILNRLNVTQDDD